MIPTPTAPDRAQRLADFDTLVEALDFAAHGPTGINLYSLRGELVEALTYAKLREDARAMASQLLATGLKPGDRVGLAAETDGDFVRAFFACQYAGLVAAPLPLPAPLGGKDGYIEQVRRMLTAAKASAAFGPAALVEWMREAADGLDTCLVGTVADLPPAASSDLPPIAPETAAYIQFSSGSTRFPMGVVVAHRALMANTRAITRDGLKITPADRAVSWLPLFHDMGLVGFLLSPLSAQMSVDLLPTGAFVRRPLLWLDLLTRNGGTVAFSPSFGYELCARRGENASIEALDLSGWRAAGIGGDMVRAAPLDRFANMFGAVGFRREAYVASYGMAEATLALTMAPLGRGLVCDNLDVPRLEREGVAATGEAAERSREFARCGPALPDHEIEVRGPDGAILPERMVGRVYARGPSLMECYFDQPEETASTMSADGWLDTGDLGYFTDGELVLTGRAKDLIILNGRNIWPQDLEWAIESEIEALRSGDTAAFSIAGDGEETVVVLVQCRSKDEEIRRGLLDDVRALLRARHSVEAKVELVGSHALPQTSSGKLSRAKARSLYLSGAMTRASEPA
ncbi:MAG: fatty acyl-AMP ligase [Caulobacteraceae bacterium]